VIHFSNLVLGRHESKVLFMWRTKNGIAVVGSFRGIKDGIETILAKEGTSSAQRAILEELRTVARASNWDFLTLKRTLLRQSCLCKQPQFPS
jgi:hypothetical protein